jgi:hypothetical protein
MKLWKSLIRVWFTLASIASFLVGWVVLAHAPKPSQFNASNVPSLPRLDPVPTLNDVMVSTRSEGFFQQQPQQRTMILRSGGS